MYQTSGVNLHVGANTPPLMLHCALCLTSCMWIISYGMLCSIAEKRWFNNLSFFNHLGKTGKEGGWEGGWEGGRQEMDKRNTCTSLEHSILFCFVYSRAVQLLSTSSPPMVLWHLACWTKCVLWCSVYIAISVRYVLYHFIPTSAYLLSCSLRPSVYHAAWLYSLSVWLYMHVTNILLNISLRFENVSLMSQSIHFDPRKFPFTVDNTHFVCYPIWHVFTPVVCSHLSPRHVNVALIVIWKKLLTLLPCMKQPVAPFTVLWCHEQSFFFPCFPFLISLIRATKTIVSHVLLLFYGGDRRVVFAKRVSLPCLYIFANFLLLFFLSFP